MTTKPVTNKPATNKDAAVTVVQYGIQTPNSKTILVVTDDLSEAMSTLDMLGSGTLIRRTVRYSPWRKVEDQLPEAI